MSQEIADVVAVVSSPVCWIGYGAGEEAEAVAVGARRGGSRKIAGVD